MDDPESHADVNRQSESEEIIPARTDWMQGMGGIPASDAMKNAATPSEALDAAARMFFGEMKEI